MLHLTNRWQTKLFTDRPFKSNDDSAHYLYVLVVSLKEEPNFFYVPLAEYKVRKSLLKSRSHGPGR